MVIDSSQVHSYQLARQLGDALLAIGGTVTTAESCTGGGVAYAITAVGGSSDWFKAGYVTYANEIKQQELGVEAATLKRFGAVSEEVVREMAAGALTQARATVAVAVSGIAGPDGGSEHKPVGTVWFAWGHHSGRLVTRCCHFSGDRAEVRQQAVAEALQGLLDILEAESKSTAV